jgi:Spy/CpxP family protein refolding chaperone
MKTLKRILGVLLIFAFGVFIGSAATSAGIIKRLRNTVLGGPEAVMEVIVQRFDRELKLDAEQKRKLQAIMDDARIELRQSRAKIKPEVEQTLLTAEARTRAILYPNQIKKFEELVGKGRAQWKAKEEGQ